MTRPVNPRPRSFRVPLTDDELAKLHKLSELAGLSATDLVRSWIEREHAAKIGSKKARKA